MLKIQRHMPEAKSEAPPIFNPDDMFKTPSIQDAVSEPQRPASPMTGVQRSIFTPFPKDMCGNPTAYFPNGKMKRWQKKQVIEASLHCSQLAVILRAKNINKRRAEKFKRQI